MTEIPCPRCRAEGTIPAYSHVCGGICFLCNGKCTILQKRIRHNPQHLAGSTWIRFRMDLHRDTQQLIAELCSREPGGKVHAMKRWYHDHTFSIMKAADRDKADRFKSRVKEAQLSYEHLEDSPHWYSSAKV